MGAGAHRRRGREEHRRQEGRQLEDQTQGEARRDGPDLGANTREAWLKSWTCLVNAALCLRMAPGTQNHIPTHVT